MTRKQGAVFFFPAWFLPKGPREEVCCLWSLGSEPSRGAQGAGCLLQVVRPGHAALLDKPETTEPHWTLLSAL